MSERIVKINDLVRDNLAKIIQQKTSLPKDVFVSILKVDTSPDLRYSRVSISIFPEKKRDETLQLLKKEIYTIQGELNKSLECNPLPKIDFVYSEVEKEASELEDIFDKIKQERENQE